MINFDTLDFSVCRQMRIQNNPSWGGGGGAQNIMCIFYYIFYYILLHHERESRSTAGGPGPLEALRVFDALSCYLSLILKHSDTNGIN